MPARILIVDDEKDMLVVLKRIITEKTDYRVVTEADPVKALESFRKQPFDLVITDLKMAKMDGIQLLEEVKKISPRVSVFVMTAYGTIETAVEAIRKGAHDYITKPLRMERVLLTIDKAMEWRRMVKENLALRHALKEKEGYPYMIGSSLVMGEIFERIKQVAKTSATVLVTGPSGSGKELVARAVHHYSPRGSNELVIVNCTTMPEQVIESELFGHLKGAFTGAWRDKKGLVQEAHEGTLFLDEIADLSPHMQTKLLRLLQDGEYKAVGSVETKRADIRIIAATNHDLDQDIKEKRFREDLYYRLNVVHIEMPPLSKRREDIPVLAYHFLEKFAQINQRDIQDISASAMQVLFLHDLPGNVRELENIIERGVIFCRGNVLEVKDLFPKMAMETAEAEAEDNSGRMPFKEAKEKMIRQFHSHYVRGLLRDAGGNISRAADMAGIQRQYLYRLIKEAGIDTEQFKNKGE